MIKSKLTYLQMADVLDKTADALDELTKGHNAFVDMSKIDVKTEEEHLCGTTTCVGGWLSVLYGERNCHWSDGANEFAKELGFGGEYESPLWRLRQFFHERPKLWGNGYGWEMFHNPLAYWNGYESSLFPFRITIASITNHWREVARSMRLASRKRTKSKDGLTWNDKHINVKKLIGESRYMAKKIKKEVV